MGKKNPIKRGKFYFTQIRYQYALHRWAPHGINFPKQKSVPVKESSVQTIPLNHVEGNSLFLLNLIFSFSTATEQWNSRFNDKSI